MSKRDAQRRAAWLGTLAQAASGLAAFQEAVVIEQEVRKGKAGHSTVTSHADLLRQDVWDRWRGGQGLAPIHAPLTDAITVSRTC